MSTKFFGPDWTAVDDALVSAVVALQDIPLAPESLPAIDVGGIYTYWNYFGILGPPPAGWLASSDDEDIRAGDETMFAMPTEQGWDIDNNQGLPYFRVEFNAEIASLRAQGLAWKAQFETLLDSFRNREADASETADAIIAAIAAVTQALSKWSDGQKPWKKGWF